MFWNLRGHGRSGEGPGARFKQKLFGTEDLNGPLPDFIFRRIRSQLDAYKPELVVVGDARGKLRARRPP